MAELMYQMFQYISCYSLSCGSIGLNPQLRVSIHLMLLFIVIPSGTWNKTGTVSIHLMLLFISKYFDSVPIEFMFQYISCYSLSLITDGYDDVIVFQYISCYSLSLRMWMLQANHHVSIHLMLLFIIVQQEA